MKRPDSCGDFEIMPKPDRDETTERIALGVNGLSGDRRKGKITKAGAGLAAAMLFAAAGTVVLREPASPGQDLTLPSLWSSANLPSITQQVDTCHWDATKNGPLIHDPEMKLLVTTNGQCMSPATESVTAYITPHDEQGNEVYNTLGQIVRIPNGTDIEVQCLASGDMTSDRNGWATNWWVRTTIDIDVTIPLDRGQAVDGYVPVDQAQSVYGYLPLTSVGRPSATQIEDEMGRCK